MSETLIGLVRHYSPSGHERDAVAWLVERMRALGYSHAGADPAGNAVGVMGSGPRQVVLLGHIDTVPGEIPVRLEGGILRGRGAVDAKGPLACFVDAAAQLGPVDGWQWVVIGAVEEERRSDGARYAAGQYRPEYAVIGEPNRWDRVALGYKGAAQAAVTVRRPQVHSASRQKTACEAAVNAWLTVQAECACYNQTRPRIFDQVLPALMSFQSGEDGFEQWAGLQVAFRLPPALSPEQWGQRLNELLPETAVSLSEAPIAAWEGEKNNRLVRAFLQAIRRQGGQPAFVYKTGTCDANIIVPVWQCPTLVYGPGDSTLDHTPDEHLALDEYRRSVDVVAAVLCQLSSAKGSSSEKENREPEPCTGSV